MAQAKDTSATHFVMALKVSAVTAPSTALFEDAYVWLWQLPLN